MRVTRARPIDELFDKYLLGYDIIINDKRENAYLDTTLIKSGISFDCLFSLSSITSKERKLIEDILEKISKTD